MPAADCRRYGTRVAVSKEIEAIIYSQNALPDFCSEYEINLGGIKVNTPLECYKDINVQVTLFDNKGHKLEFASTVIKGSASASIIRFDDVSPEKEVILREMLVLQQALI